MGPVNLALWVGGVLLIAFGYLRARPAWERYQSLKAEDENIRRYERWRGGVRDASRSGASVAMELSRRQAQIGAAIIGVGFVLVLAGFAIR